MANRYEFETLMKYPVALSADLYKPPYNKIRRIVILILLNNLMKNRKFRELPTCIYGTDTRLSIVVQLELSIYNTSIVQCESTGVLASWSMQELKDIYNCVSYKIASNISSTVKNDKLIDQILDGKTDIAHYTSVELFPEKYSDLKQRIELSKNIKINKKTTTLYRCKRCHSRQCTLQNVINRSIDEGVSLTATCVVCGFAWNV